MTYVGAVRTSIELQERTNKFSNEFRQSIAVYTMLAIAL